MTKYFGAEQTAFPSNLHSVVYDLDSDADRTQLRSLPPRVSMLVLHQLVRRTPPASLCAASESIQVASIPGINVDTLILLTPIASAPPVAGVGQRTQRSRRMGMIWGLAGRDADRRLGIGALRWAAIWHGRGLVAYLNQLSRRLLRPDDHPDLDRSSSGLFQTGQPERDDIWQLLGIGRDLHGINCLMGISLTSDDG
jgi:hypothetical protein